MNELVNLIVKKTGIPSATAQNTVNVVLLQRRLVVCLSGVARSRLLRMSSEI
jgi:hypothetical protein